MLDSLQQFITLVPNVSHVALDVFDLIDISLTVFPEVVVAGFLPVDGRPSPLRVEYKLSARFSINRT